jgi:hypothetical protein
MSQFAGSVNLDTDGFRRLFVKLVRLTCAPSWQEQKRHFALNMFSRRGVAFVGANEQKPNIVIRLNRIKQAREEDFCKALQGENLQFWVAAVRGFIRFSDVNDQKVGVGNQVVHETGKPLIPFAEIVKVNGRWAMRSDASGDAKTSHRYVVGNGVSANHAGDQPQRRQLWHHSRLVKPNQICRWLAFINSFAVDFVPLKEFKGIVDELLDNPFVVAFRQMLDDGFAFQLVWRLALEL